MVDDSKSFHMPWKSHLSVKLRKRLAQLIISVFERMNFGASLLYIISNHFISTTLVVNIFCWNFWKCLYLQNCTQALQKPCDQIKEVNQKFSLGKRVSYMFCRKNTFFLRFVEKIHFSCSKTNQMAICPKSVHGSIFYHLNIFNMYAPPKKCAKSKQKW